MEILGFLPRGKADDRLRAELPIAPHPALCSFFLHFPFSDSAVLQCLLRYPDCLGTGLPDTFQLILVFHGICFMIPGSLWTPSCCCLSHVPHSSMLHTSGRLPLLAGGFCEFFLLQSLQGFNMNQLLFVLQCEP